MSSLVTRDGRRSRDHAGSYLETRSHCTGHVFIFFYFTFFFCCLRHISSVLSRGPENDGRATECRPSAVNSGVTRLVETRFGKRERGKEILRFLNILPNKCSTGPGFRKARKTERYLLIRTCRGGPRSFARSIYRIGRL